MKKIKYVLISLVAILSVVSCKDWLDVSPNTRVLSKVMFESESGFRDALYGVYTIMGRDSTYGASMTVTVMDVIAQMYSITGTNFEKLEALDYEDATAELYIDKMWLNNYYAIANCNNILDNIDDRKSVFATTGSYEMVKAEAMALRAFLHFDILRVFGPVPLAANLDKPAIPVMKELTEIASKQSTINEIVDFVLEDLDTARKLIEPYDRIGPAYDEYTDEGYSETYSLSEEQYTDGGFAMYRRSRMNYYAMTAVMARAAQWAGRSADALIYAKEVLESGKFPMVDEDVYNNTLELVPWMARNEYVFGLYKSHMQARIHEYYISRGDYGRNTNLQWRESDVNQMFEGDRDFDWRYKKLFALSSSADYYTVKYETGYRIPLIKIAEMYYIAAEASGQVSYLNELRKYRGFENFPLPADTDLRQALMTEYRREFAAEGQFFYFCKRHNIEKFPNGKQARGYYVLPMPDDEIEFGNIITNEE